ncbi:MAG: Rieske 2Fe-2S domain-containing protein, partial [Panacagrimonas sp.]
MFLKNAWYCAGWDSDVTTGKDALVSRKIANELLVLYRTTTGKLVAMADRCPHRQAALSLGRKEGDSLRCMYHGMKFSSDGVCTEIPGQSTIPERACVQTYPVVEKDNWIWVWMGEPTKADPNLICFSVGPGHPDWSIKTSQMRVNTNYRLEVANLADLSHLAWVHEQTVGGSPKYSSLKAQY